MKQKNLGQPFTAAEKKLVQQLRDRPAMMARMQRILELAWNADGPLKTADEVEELLVQEIRQLGQTTMGEWASQAEAQVGAELQHQDPTVRSHKKKR